MMNTARIYHDGEGNECSIHQMVKYEPERTASRFQFMEDRIAELEAELAEYVKCDACQGSGRMVYGSTAVYMGGMGGAAMTEAECEKCWGTGLSSHKGANLKDIADKNRDGMASYRKGHIKITRERDRAQAKLAAAERREKYYIGEIESGLECIEHLNAAVAAAERTITDGQARAIEAMFREFCPHNMEGACMTPYTCEQCSINAIKAAAHTPFDEAAEKGVNLAQPEVMAIALKAADKGKGRQ